MKLISLNVEGLRHRDRIMPFLEEQMADVVCLQETAKEYEEILHRLGYTTRFLPRCIKDQEGVEFIDGILIGSLHPVSFEEFYYYKHSDEIPVEVYDEKSNRKTCLQGVVIAHVTYEEKIYTIATTHFTWAPDGDIATEAQETDTHALLKIMTKYEPHIICGDFNIPRGHNHLYETLTSVYTDSIPLMYASSLDTEFHRLRLDENQKDKLDRYMVDYIFTQNPYTAEDVRLQFGLSDHAAVLATIQQ